MTHSLKLIAMTAALPLLFSCGRERSVVEVGEARSETLCEISQEGEDGQIGRINSLAVVDADRFVLCSETHAATQVHLYDMAGRRLAGIGRTGRARYEYVMPLIVRTDGKSIYVWCAMSLKFIEYTLEGEPVAEYPYESAIRDFVPCGSKIVIYASGKRKEHIVDIYDKASGEVVSAIGEPSPSHVALLGWLSVAPVTIDGDKVLFMPQDKLELLSYDLETGGLETRAEIESDSFAVSELGSEPSPDARRRYIYENSYAVMLTVKDGAVRVLASEGEYMMREGVLSKEDRFCSVYELKGARGRKVSSFRVDSFGSSNMLSSYGGDIYYVYHTLENGEDAYRLRKLLP